MLKMAQHLITKALPSTVLTRLELFEARARMTLFTATADMPYNPSILFHVGRSCVSAVMFGSNYASSINALPRSGKLDSALIDNFTTLSDFKAKFSTGNTPGRAELVGVPNIIMGDDARPVGGLLRIKVLSGPSTRGTLTVKAMGYGDMSKTPAALKAEMVADPGADRYEFVSKGLDLVFKSPLENPDKLYDFETATTSWGWGPQDAFGGLFITIDDVAISASDSAPVIEVTAIHSLQCTLPTASRSLATNHGIISPSKLTSFYGHSMNCVNAMEDAAKFGLAYGAGYNAVEAAGIALFM